MEVEQTHEKAPATVTTGSPFLDKLLKDLANSYPSAVQEAGQGLDMPTLRVDKSDAVEVCRWLRDAPGYRYRLISDLTCVDYLAREPRFDVVYHLYSLDLHSYIRVKTGVAEDPCECPTMTGVFVGANWLEREVWDMFGVDFIGHPGLDRILTPDGWEYFALRRDFPLQGPGLIKLYDSVTDVF
jgi:NADH-quinone oxidoreductase subunit C